MAIGNYNHPKWQNIASLKAMSDAQLDAKINQGLAALSGSLTSQTAQNSPAKLQIQRGINQKGINQYVDAMKLQISPNTMVTTTSASGTNFQYLDVPPGWAKSTMEVLLNEYPGPRKDKLSIKAEKIFNKLHKKVSKELSLA